MQGLKKIRVVDFSNRIAGHYTSKMLVDAGAEVIKIEPQAGDALREREPFFRYLNTGKKSIVGKIGETPVLELIASADLVIETFFPDSDELKQFNTLNLCNRFPSLVVLSISPYGRSGPYVNKVATEFTIQADSGSLSTRGRRDQPPVMAGGKITEYVSGTFAAVAALAAVMRAQKTGIGEYIDFSMLEVFNIAGTSYADMMSSLWGRPEVSGVMRNVEVPSIEPTKDGWVGFATNSFQQYSDFLVMIGRPDLLEQKDLANAQGRSKRMQEWNEIVHAWTRQHTTAEILEIAALLRIPVAPVNNGKTVFEQEQLISRKVFVENPKSTSTQKTFLQPRPPYLINGKTPFAFRPAPLLNEHKNKIEARTKITVNKTNTAPELPLKGIRVLDATAWWAGPSATQMLAHLGAEVLHLEAIQRPDGSRMMGGMHTHQKQWYEYSAMFLSANTNKLGLTLNLENIKGVELAKELIKHCDVFVENYSPRVIEKFGLDWQTVHAINNKCIMVRMPAFGLDGPWKNHVGFAQTMEQISGMAWLTGHPDDQPRIQRGPCDPMAGMNAAFATLVALNERDLPGKQSTQLGSLIECSMVEGALNAAAEQIIEYSTYGNITQRMGNRCTDAAPQGLYHCANHDKKHEQWLALSIETDKQWQTLKKLLGTPAWSENPELTTLAGRQNHHDSIDRELQAHLADKSLTEILQAWTSDGIPVAPVTSSLVTWKHPQLVYRQFFEELAHPVVGKHLHVSAPFSFASLKNHNQRWLRSPAPTVGQHNHVILSELLGLSDADIKTLEQAEVIGTHLKGL